MENPNQVILSQSRIFFNTRIWLRHDPVAKWLFPKYAFLWCPCASWHQFREQTKLRPKIKMLHAFF